MLVYAFTLVYTHTHTLTKYLRNYTILWKIWNQMSKFQLIWRMIGAVKLASEGIIVLRIMEGSSNYALICAYAYMYVCIYGYKFRRENFNLRSGFIWLDWYLIDAWNKPYNALLCSIYVFMYVLLMNGLCLYVI